MLSIASQACYKASNACYETVSQRQGALCYSQRTAPRMVYNECGIARQTDVETASVIIPFSFGFELYILEMLKKSGRLTRTLHFFCLLVKKVFCTTRKNKGIHVSVFIDHSQWKKKHILKLPRFVLERRILQRLWSRAYKPRLSCLRNDRRVTTSSPTEVTIHACLLLPTVWETVWRCSEWWMGVTEEWELIECGRDYKKTKKLHQSYSSVKRCFLDVWMCMCECVEECRLAPEAGCEREKLKNIFSKYMWMFTRVIIIFVFISLK